VPASALHEWQNFFMILGTASATLIGAMFVVVSIGIGFLTRDRSPAIRTFLTSTVANLSTVLLGAAWSFVPALDWLWFGGGIGLAGIGGLVYATHVLFGFRQHDGTDPSDWFWYAVFPLAGYALLLVAAVAALHDGAVGVDIFAAALAAFLVVGIRNAWDMIVFLVTLTRGSE
jgi:hypothetical protein